MKKRSVLILFLSLFLINFASADHTAVFVGGSNSVQVNQNELSVFNISITNNNAEQGGEITQVVIKFPLALNFPESNFGTDAQIASSKSSSDAVETTIFWSGQNLIGSSETKNFWFTANATLNANYVLTIITLNTTSMSNSQLSVTTSGSLNCVANWSCSQFNPCINGIQNRTCTDINNCNDLNSKPLEDQNCSDSCVPNWQCTSFSICSNGFQIRSCVDSNSCGDETSKPSENQTCEATCNPKWNCSDWTPLAENCPKDKTQTRICTDTNNCNDATSKPPENQTCEYKSNAGLAFIILAVVLGFLAIFLIAIIISTKMKENLGSINKIKKIQI